MNQVGLKYYVAIQGINHLHINVHLDDNGKKILDSSTAPQGTNEMKKKYVDLIELNKQRIGYNTLAIDTRKIQQLDCDNEELFEKYFGHLKLKENTPYYLSISKKLPHYLVRITNIPNSMPRKGFKYGQETVVDVLAGLWAWAPMDCELHNSSMEGMFIDWNVLKDINDQMNQDYLNEKKLQKEKEKQSKIKEKQSKIKEKELKNLKKKKVTLEELRECKVDEELNDLLGLTDSTTNINKKDTLLLELLPKELSDDREKWVNIGYVIYDLYRNNYDEGLRRFTRFSKLSSKCEENKIKTQYDSFKNSRHELTMASVVLYLEQINPKMYKIYKLICECIDFKFRDQDLANMFYEMFKDDYVCAYFEPKDCWFKYEKGMYRELNGKALIGALMPDVGKKLLTYQAVLKYTVNLFNKLEATVDSTDPDIEYFIDSGRFYGDLLKKMYDADDYCNSAKGQDNVYRCCKVSFYNYEFLNKLNQNLHLLGFGDNVFDLTRMKPIKEEYKQAIANGNPVSDDHIISIIKRKIVDMFRPATKEDYVSVKTGMTMEDCINDKIKTSTAEKYLKSVFPYPGQYEYMLTLLSDSVYGKNRQRFCVNMGIGKNSKSLLQGLMKRAFGGYFGTMKPSFVTARDDDNCSSANSEFYACKYVRSLWISEPPENKSLNGSRMKSLAGNDEMTVRELYKASETFVPQFSIYINCNTTFKLESCSDISLPRRIKFNPFTQFFTKKPDPRNPCHSKENPKLENEEYLIKLSRSLMRLLLEHYVKIDLLDPTHDVDEIEPQLCKDTKKQFIETGDSFQEFFEQKYELTLTNRRNYVIVPEFYTNYVDYCKTNQYRPLGKNLFIGKMKLLFPNPSKYYFPGTTSVTENKVKKYINNVCKGIRERDPSEIEEAIDCDDDDDDEYEEEFTHEATNANKKKEITYDNVFDSDSE